MAAVSTFFQAHDEAEQCARVATQGTAPVAFNLSSFLAEHESAQRNAAAGMTALECNFSLMAKLPGHWDAWTGNEAPSEDLIPFLNNSNSNKVDRHAFARETIKIAFKPAVWQRSTHRPKQQHQFTRVDALGNVVTTSGTEEAPEFAGEERDHHAGATFDEDANVPFGRQEAYATPRLFASPAEGAYWSSFSFTECLMASPVYQHLSSEKFHALEHFAVLRSFQDGEAILLHQQRFFSIFFVRYVETLGQFVYRRKNVCTE